MENMEVASFTAFRDAPLHLLTPEEWAAWYPGMAAWLDDEDATTRREALERLVTGVFRSEGSWSDSSRSHPTPQLRRRRAIWLLDTVERAHARHSDLIPALLSHLRWHGDDEPFPQVLIPWLNALRQRRLPGVQDEIVEGTALLVGGLGTLEEGDMPESLDHPSDYVRACAAKALSRTGVGVVEENEPGYFSPDFIRKLTDKELARPGIAGPFWSGCCFGSDTENLGFDPLEWMLDIIERRIVPEPAGMPFNGVDFHVHELAACSPDAVRRLMRAGRPDLALMAATEISGVVEGMAPLLHEFAALPQTDLASGAQLHLAAYYGEAHPNADPALVRRLQNWRTGVDAFVIRYGNQMHWVDVVVCFPTTPKIFDDIEAWEIVDAAMPVNIRGELAKHPLDIAGDGPTAIRLGTEELRAYALGPQVNLSGDPDRRQWRRIEIVGSRAQDRWRPFAWGADTATL